MTALRWTRLAPCLSVSALLLTTASLAGQTELRVTPKAGWLQPVGGFAEAAVLDDENFISFHELDGMPLVGVDLTFSIRPSSVWSLRVGAATTVGGDATGIWDCQAIMCPDILLPVPSDVSVTVAGADLVLTPRTAWSGLRPFVLGGAGLIRHRFVWKTHPGEIFDLEPGEDTRTGLAARFGLGARWEGERLSAEVGVEDHLTWPDRPSGGSEHAVGVSAGVGYRIR